jgi:hypothetical protein
MRSETGKALLLLSLLHKGGRLSKHELTTLKVRPLHSLMRGRSSNC